MLKLTVIIVNYNVKYFIEQALYSVRLALKDIPSEVIVVDNHSTDGSCDLLREKFPEVQLITNDKNVGFSAANNQALRLAKGEYVLLLNPDTLVAEDTFKSALAFMESHSDAGALGVRMLDGKGNFLPESKRGLPIPLVAFFKIFGLSRLFPKSRWFGGYHLGYLDEHQTHEVEVLAGAFMLIRKKVLDEVGLLDESFFMYGEDIDLSYRITQAGYKNYYYPDAPIIHYKGESTKKGSLNYVRIFYKAMALFAQKHFSTGQARLYSLFIYLAIYLKASMSVLGGLVKKLLLPLLDFTLLYAGLIVIQNFWATNIKHAPEYYPPEFKLYIIPAYIVIWLFSSYLSGGYDRPVKVFRLIRGLVVGTVFIAAFYAFLDESLRFSRAIILLGAVWAAIAMMLLRLLLGWFGSGRLLRFANHNSPRLIIVGSHEEGKRAWSLLMHTGMEHRFIGYVFPERPMQQSDDYLGVVEDLPQLKTLYQLDEVVFCIRDVSVQRIIELMQRLGPELNYKMISEGDSIVGSNSKNTAGDLYAIDINLAIGTPMVRRNKRMLDIAMSLLLLVVYPIGAFLVRKPLGLLGNIVQVMAGKSTWVGYVPGAGGGQYQLPEIRKGILSPQDVLAGNLTENSGRLNLIYAKDYTVYQDIRIIWKGFSRLGNSPA